MTRVEGEGSLRLRIERGEIEELALTIFEPPRYFEKFLEGRQCHEVIDTVARICGICPIAYQMSAAQALENALGMTPSDWVRDMRRVFYCGEWLQATRCMSTCSRHRTFSVSTALSAWPRNTRKRSNAACACRASATG